MKRCSGCGRMLPEGAFSRNRSRPDGLNNWCKECYARAKQERKLRMPYSAEELMFRPVEHIAEAIIDRQERVLTTRGLEEALGISHGEIHEYCRAILDGSDYRWRDSHIPALRSPEAFRKAVVAHLESLLEAKA